MFHTTALIVAAGVSLVAAAPFSYPLPDGFPYPSDAQLQAMQTSAGGPIPNGGGPATIHPSTVTALQLVAFNELSEVAFYWQFLQNITNNVPGYAVPDANREFVIDALTAIVSQEEIHTLLPNGALEHYGETAVEPCQYVFPVSSYNESLALANSFTNTVIGTLASTVQMYGMVGDASLIAEIGTVIGQEGQQSGGFRIAMGKRPSANAYPTYAAPALLYSLVTSFTVPGSCPNSGMIDIPILAPLHVVTQTLGAVDSTVQFSVARSGPAVQGLSVAYLSGQMQPVVVAITDVEVQNSDVVFTASFPFVTRGFSEGLTLVALVNGTGPFADADAVAAAAVYGPGLIEI